jgi:hypothetical protein
MMSKQQLFLAAAGLLVLALILFSPFASEAPDGLEKAAESEGFEEKAADTAGPAPFPDYSVSWVRSSYMRTVLAGLIGALAVLALTLAAAKLLARREKEQSQDKEAAES